MSIAREPLLHFAIAGALLFAGYAYLNSRQPVVETVAPIHVGKGEVAWLTATWAEQWLRHPSNQELQGLVSDLVTEELFAREAEAIGLAENDTIIRRRLAQKLTFLVEDTARLGSPSDAQLKSYYQANAARYRTSAKLSFKQVYFNPKQDGDLVDARTTLAALPVADRDDPDAIAGDSFLFDSEFSDIDEASVTAMFGPEFSRILFATELGDWRGPVRSGYGDHLVFVVTKTPGTQRSFENARDLVLEEWRADQQRVASQAYTAGLREKYGVVVDDEVNELLGRELMSEPASR